MKTVFILMAATATLALGGCGTTQYAGFSNKALSTTALVQNPDCDPVSGACVLGSNVNPKRIVPEKAKLAATRYSEGCNEDITKIAAGPAQSIVNGAVPGAVAGSSLHVGVKFVSKTATGYGPYGAVSGLANGGAGGLAVGAQSAGIGKSECTKGMLEDVKRDIPGTHAVTLFAGKAWGAPDQRAYANKK